MKVGVFGAGVVGGALIDYLRELGHSVLVKDPGLGIEDEMVQDDVSAYFICVPAPTVTDNEKYFQDLSMVEDCLAQIPKHSLVFMRSTMAPKTCDRLGHKYNLRLHSMPEFLTERTAHEDMDRLEIICAVKNSLDYNVVNTLFSDKKVLLCSNHEAEFSKLVHNAFAAVKVNFFNTVKEYCEENELDYGVIIRNTLLSGYINKEHTSVPGHDGFLGYGGKCLPKDVKLFHECVKHISGVPLVSDIENGVRRGHDYANKNVEPKEQL